MPYSAEGVVTLETKRMPGRSRSAGAAQLVVAEGPLLEQTLHSLVIAGLGGYAVNRLEAARARTRWGRSSRRRLALLDGKRLIGSAMEADLSAICNGETIPVSVITAISFVAGIRAVDWEGPLIDGILQRARATGAAMVLLVRSTDGVTPAGFEAVPVPDMVLSVAKPDRYGAPMTMVRGGEERDLAAIVAMGRVRAARFRLHLDRTSDLIQHAITTKRLLAGLTPVHTRHLQFFIAEEGATAAAYVVISSVGGTWTIEECGDRDSSGARVGALLQALIAREPSEERPTITAWLPAGLRPPQVTAIAAPISTHVLMVRDLRSAAPLRLRPDDVLFWRNDFLT